MCQAGSLCSPASAGLHTLLPVSLTTPLPPSWKERRLRDLQPPVSESLSVKTHFSKQGHIFQLLWIRVWTCLMGHHPPYCGHHPQVASTEAGCLVYSFLVLLYLFCIYVSVVESGDPSSRGPQFLVRTQRRISSYLLPRKLINNKERKNRSWRDGHDWAHRKEEQRGHFKGEMGHAGEAMAPEGCSTEFLRQGYLHNPGGLLIDSCRLYNKILYPPVFLIIQSTLIRCMYSWSIYEQLMSPVTTKGYFSVKHVPE